MKPVLVCLSILLGSLAPLRAADILFLLERGFNFGEFYQLYLPLKALGYDIDIASGEAGVVHLPKDDIPDDRDRDAFANLALSEVDDISGYRALVIPGGYSPGFLEQDPDALRIVAAFEAREDKTIAAVCHGPRLLLASDLLRDRVWTGLHQIPSELADVWTSPRRGAYLDQQVVTDGGLLTARYPQDTPALARTLIEKLAAEGGPGLPTVTGRYLMLTEPGPPPHVAWALRDPLRVLGFEVAAKDAFDPAQAEEFDGVIAFRTSENENPALPNLGTLPVTVLEVPEGPFAYPELLPGLLAFAMKHGEPAPAIETPAFDAALALAPGFDDRVAAAMHAWLRARGHNVAVLGPEPGWIRGLHGVPFEVDGSYANPPDLAPNAWIVAPGVLWPEKDDKARQTEQPDWIEAQAERDAVRRDWLLTAYDAGHPLALIGLDALRLGRLPRFKGSEFASTRQAQWSFGREGGRFSTDAARKSADRLLSASGFDALPDLWTHMNDMTPIEKDPTP